jgi:PAS domain S-box-containing protein
MSESATDPRTPLEDRPVVTAVIGGGGGCEAMLRMVQEDTLGRFRMSVRGVADTNPNAPGMCYARQIGIELVTTDYRELYEISDLGLLIELTGSNEVWHQVERTHPRNVRLIDHFGARLFWQLHQAEEAIIKQRTEMRERMQAERDLITQIFDSIPDEVVVIDTDMVIQQANASFLKNNNVTIEQIRSRYCYDVGQTVRGDCQVALDNCPFIDVVRTKEKKGIVRKHFDKEGIPRYTAIVAAPLTDSEGKLTGIIEMTRDITHRISLEEELKATEVRLQQFLEMAPLATYVKNRQGQYIEVNPATCELLGRPKSEIIGRTDREILPQDAATILRAGDRVVLHKREQFSNESAVQLGGKQVYLTTTKYPVIDAEDKVTAIVGLSRDETARRKAEQELQRTREYLQNILDSSYVIIITTDLEGRIVSFNRGAEHSLDYEADEVIGKPASMLFRSPKEREPLVRRVQQGSTIHDHDGELVRKDGAEVAVSMTLSQLADSTGEPIGTVEISRDISHRRGLMNQVIQSERLAAVGRLAAGVAHEINNPLAVIAEVAGYLEDLRSGIIEVDREKLEQELHEGLSTIAAQVKRCSSITHRLLGFARKSEARVEVADVNAALDEILPFLEKEARMANVQIHREYPAEIPQLSIEEVQLEEILINLITNAIQAMTERGYGNIWIMASPEDGKVVLSVRDDGPGIDKAVRDRLFDPFVSTKPRGHGTGLGLSICYGIVKRFDGEIRVDSEPGEGATFQVVLRMHQKSPSSESNAC